MRPAVQLKGRGGARRGAVSLVVTCFASLAGPGAKAPREGPAGLPSAAGSERVPFAVGSPCYVWMVAAASYRF